MNEEDRYWNAMMKDHAKHEIREAANTGSVIEFISFMMRIDKDCVSDEDEYYHIH